MNETRLRMDVGSHVGRFLISVLLPFPRKHFSSAPTYGSERANAVKYRLFYVVTATTQAQEKEGIANECLKEREGNPPFSCDRRRSYF